MIANRIATVLLCLICGACSRSQASRESTRSSLDIPPVGSSCLKIVSPTVLELTLITTKDPPPAKVEQWDWVRSKGKLSLPGAEAFKVTAGSRTLPVKAVGFKRRVRYAPLDPRDLRIGNYLYLQLSQPIEEGEVVEVKDPSNRLWEKTCQFTAKADPSRLSPAIHVNQVGYVPEFPKTAMIGFFMGNLGEMEVSSPSGFDLIDAASGHKVYQGALKPRPDMGYETKPVPYQKVLMADFSDFKQPGEYRVSVQGLGASFPFFIDEGAAAAVARTYALGLYHQRCGGSNALPFSRFTHAPCYVAPAEVPTARFTKAARFIARASEDFSKNEHHLAPQLKDFDTSLYPFVRTGKVDVAGGHHDAGDYSKYTINSAGLIHALVFAADALPGVGALDNLGLPESGDGRSDLLQEAKWEADFLVKMQDEDGGFYFLVYPREREYENDCLPDQGDSQIVWPKNTAVTAAAVAALAQTGSSPLFRKQFPQAAALYLQKAAKGWTFLERALARYGADGSYQKLTHYGDEFMHKDELAWAACEMYLATGDDSIHQRLLAEFDPTAGETRRWGWWRLYESYGRAIRSYAFAAKTGRVRSEQLNQTFLRGCENELLAGAEDQVRWSQQSAYGTSFPTETKRFRGGGWYFSMDQAFDLAVAAALDHPAANDPRPRYLQAILANVNFEAGCNPVDVSYLTGLGWKRPHEIVHQYAMNDRRRLPPDGIPVGNVQSGFAWLDNYKEDLKSLSFPGDDAEDNPYPIYDRWGDSFNVQTEFVVVNQARGLATAAYLMARTSLTNQSSQVPIAQIAIHGGTASLTAGNLDLTQARVIWEADGQEPCLGPTLACPEGSGKAKWIEAEAQLPDGRRIFAVSGAPPSKRR